jgi:hypothetical protein
MWVVVGALVLIKINKVAKRRGSVSHADWLMEKRVMKKLLSLGVFVVMALAATGCAGSLDEDDGLVIMTPYINEELGTRGVQPDGMSDQLHFEQSAVPLSLDEVYPLFLEQTDLEEFPKPVGRLKGIAFTWDLYTVETTILNSGLDTVRIDIAVAERDMTTYFVLMITFPDDYDDHARMYETIFTHAVYALAPLE